MTRAPMEYSKVTREGHGSLLIELSTLAAGELDKDSIKLLIDGISRSHVSC